MLITLKKILDETFKQFIIIGATVLKEMFNIKREQNTIKFLTDMFVDLEQAMPNKKKRLTKANELVAPICSQEIFKPYIDFYLFYLKYKVDVSSYLDAYKSLQEFKSKHDKIKEKLKNLTLKGNTKYSFLISERDNKITTTSEDPAYNFEVEAFNLRQIINISICVLEKQMQTFKKHCIRNIKLISLNLGKEWFLKI